MGLREAGPRRCGRRECLCREGGQRLERESPVDGVILTFIFNEIIDLVEVQSVGVIF